ncbi:MAG: ABC transporter permease [Desulfobacteraceae bacterium]|nr:ABC transporter permease [Desulfobacteraceae bacterium]
MLRHIIRRIISLIPVFFGVTFISFFILHLSPGDPAELMAGVEASQEDIDAIRKQYGLDKPLLVQYGVYIKNVMHGDMGVSLRTQRPVITEVWARYPATLELATVSVVVASIIGLLMGIIAASHQNSIFDYGSMVVALFSISMPIFWLGLMLMLFFSVYLGWFPAVGRGGISHLVLPAISLGTQSAAVIARMTRSSLLEVIRQDYVQTARAKGLSERVVVYKHAVRNALIPVITVMGMQFGYLLSGSVLTESVFAWPGVGRLMVQSIYARDYPVVQAAILLVAVNFVLVNLLVDLLYGYINPRVRVE